LVKKICVFSKKLNKNFIVKVSGTWICVETE
jgi:hypothetical protein